MEEIKEFRGEYRFLSNFYVSPFSWSPFREWEELSEELTDLIYLVDTVEHGYQAYKAIGNGDYSTFSKILMVDTPQDAKRAGRNIRLNIMWWESVKEPLMAELVRLKFAANEKLRKKLIDTHPATLIEGNTWGDVEWGMVSGFGKNKLGRILMQERERLCQSK